MYSTTYCNFVSQYQCYYFMTKIFNTLLVVISFILILMSVIALISVHLTLSESAFSFTPDGFNSYLKALGQYGSLFAGTISVVVAYFGLLRLNAATEANKDKRKQDYFAEWKLVLEIRSLEIKDRDPRMVREFTRLRYSLYEELYSKHFEIKNKIELQSVFNGIFGDGIIKFFESMNETRLGMGDVYPSSTYSYSLDSFRFLFLGCLKSYYDELENDLQKLYLEEMDPNRIIDKNLYQSALDNFYARKYK